MRIACIIPARGGSKGVPRKNIKPLGAIPLIAYTIRVALAAGAVDTVAVSTEDREIAEVAAHYGAQVIPRPASLAEDHIKSEPVIAHGVTWLEEKNPPYDGVLLLSPTNPFRNPDYIRAAVSLFKNGDYDTIVGLVPIYKYAYEVRGNDAKPLYAERKNRQERTPVFLENGSLYLCRATLARNEQIFGRRVGQITMDELASINIDSPTDFLHAEAVVRAGLFTLS